jgi:hypothetical protein
MIAAVSGFAHHAAARDQALTAAPAIPRANTGNLGSSDDVDQIWWRLDEVPVDGFLGGERGAVGAAYDAGVVPATALVEPFEQLSDRLSGGAA